MTIASVVFRRHGKIGDVQLGKTTANLETKNIAFPAPRSGD
jgi:hypothetical protein